MQFIIKWRHHMMGELGTSGKFTPYFFSFALTDAPIMSDSVYHEKRAFCCTYKLVKTYCFLRILHKGSPWVSKISCVSYFNIQGMHFNTPDDELETV